MVLKTSTEEGSVLLILILNMAHISLDEAPGYDCVFVKKPEEIQADCPICYLVLREPAQMRCCGSVFCMACITTELRHRNVCPMCQRPNPKSPFLDKRIKQSLSGFRVHCIHYTKEREGESKGGRGRGRRGCDWVGQLRDLERHLNKNPPEDTQMNGCLYAEIKCKFCCNRFQRSLINDHQTKQCTKRPYSCPHCQYNSTYIVITGEHEQTCPCFPEQCRHCKKVLERQKLNLHIRNECTLKPIVCDFHLVGCQEELYRPQMEDHIRNNGVYHALLLAKFAEKHPNDRPRLEEYLPMLKSSVNSLKELEAKNKLLKRQKYMLAPENELLKKWRNVLAIVVVALAVFVALLEFY